MSPSDLSERLWDFAARIGKVVDALPDSRLGRHIAGQLVRSGTSSPPNYDEGCAAESRADFVHKLGVALKEMKRRAAGCASSSKPSFSLRNEFCLSSANPKSWPTSSPNRSSRLLATEPAVGGGEIAKPN